MNIQDKIETILILFCENIKEPDTAFKKDPVVLLKNTTQQIMQLIREIHHA